MHPRFLNQRSLMHRPPSLGRSSNVSKPSNLSTGTRDTASGSERRRFTAILCFPFSCSRRRKPRQHNTQPQVGQNSTSRAGSALPTRVKDVVGPETLHSAPSKPYAQRAPYRRHSEQLQAVADGSSPEKVQRAAPQRHVPTRLITSAATPAPSKCCNSSPEGCAITADASAI